MAYSYTGSAVTGKVVGDVQNFMAIAILENGPYSGHKVTVRRVVSQSDMTALVASTTLFVPLLTYRGTAAITKGALVTYAEKCPFSTSESSDTEVRLWYPATSDGINDSVLAGTESGGIAWRQWTSKLRTGVEQFRAEDNNQLPALVQTYDMVLYPGQYLVFRADPVVVTDNNPGVGFFIEVLWQEELLTPRYVTGTVTDYAAGDGSGITVRLFRDADKSYVASTVTATGGTYSFTVYDTTISYFTDAYVDGTHVGRSDVGTAT